MVVYTERNDKRNVKYYTSLFHRLNCHSIEYFSHFLLLFANALNLSLCVDRFGYANSPGVTLTTKLSEYFCFILLSFYLYLWTFSFFGSVTEVCVKRMLSPWLYPELIYRWSRLFDRQQKVVGVLFGFVEQVSGRGPFFFDSHSGCYLVRDWQRFASIGSCYSPLCLLWAWKIVMPTSCRSRISNSSSSTPNNDNNIISSASSQSQYSSNRCGSMWNVASKWAGRMCEMRRT